MFSSSRRYLGAIAPTFLTASLLAAQIEVASLHPSKELVWQRTSPEKGSIEGPVLYQLIFRSNATPGNLLVLSPQFALTNSLVSQDTNGVHIGGLTIQPKR